MVLKQELNGKLMDKTRITMDSSIPLDRRTLKKLKKELSSPPKVTLYAYRFEYDYDTNDYAGKLILIKFPVVRRTTSGYWIKIRYRDCSIKKNPNREKFILRGSRNSFAYMSIEKAWENYIRRTIKYREIISKVHRNVTRRCGEIENITGIKFSSNNYISSMICNVPNNKDDFNYRIDVIK